jgi:hypothetical protein
LFVVAAALAAVVLLGLGAGLTFFSDEWAFIETRSLGDPTTWFEPHNEHWATASVLVYRLLVETVGLGSYMPYLAVLIALHLTVATLVHALVRRSSGPWPALGVGVVVLFFGSGFENLYWAFQIGFVGALAAGLAAIVVFDARPLTTRRALGGAFLLVVSLATQGGPGLVLCLAVGLELLLDPARRRAVIVLAVPAAAYAAWYLAIGRVGLEGHQGLFSLGGLDDLPPAIATGLATAVGSLLGLGTALGGIAAVIAIAAMAAATLRRGRLDVAPRAVACLVAAAALYGLIALARSFAGPDVVFYTRYTYIAAILIVVGAAAQVGRPDLRTMTRRRAWLVGGAVFLTLSLIWNARLLVDGRALFRERAQTTRAFVAVALERPLPATTDPDRTLVTVPSPNALERIVGAYGSPLQDWLAPWAVPPLDPGWLAEAQRVLEVGAEIPLPQAPAP